MSPTTTKASLKVSVCQVMRFALNWPGALLLVSIGLPGFASAETCTMYEKYLKTKGAGTSCESTPNFIEVEATSSPPGLGTYYARKVPKCDVTGTDEGCGLPGAIENGRIVDPDAGYVRSLDGTRAFYYIDPNPASTEWVFFFDGGGSCGEMLGSNAAKACYAGKPPEVGFDGYDSGEGDAYEMTTMHPCHLLDPNTCGPSSTVPDRKSGEGILSSDPDNLYADSNRVWFNKSSFDRFMGNTDNIKRYEGDDIVLYFHGRRIIEAVIKELNRPSGARFEVGEETVPDLSSADRVLFAGLSGGAGGLIHNAEWIKDRIREVAPTIKVKFLVSSRMLPWIEAEALWASPLGDSIWSDRFSGISEVLTDTCSVVEQPEDDPCTRTSISYSEGTFKPGGEIRQLLNSWGDITDPSTPFLDDDCKADHYDEEHNRWKCYDEGHVALYHMKEDVFFFESLEDGTHAGDASPVFWMDTKDGEILNPGFVWSPDYKRERSNRVLYTVNSILLNRNHRGIRGFYVPDVNAHAMVKSSSFYDEELEKFGLSYSFARLLDEWERSTFAMDAAVVQDGAFWAFHITWASIHPAFGGGWTRAP
jgi:hypothetical protein